MNLVYRLTALHNFICIDRRIEASEKNLDVEDHSDDELLQVILNSPRFPYCSTFNIVISIILLDNMIVKEEETRKNFVGVSIQFSNY
jgi:hypothetical protein